MYAIDIQIDWSAFDMLLPWYAIVKVKVWGINHKPNMATSEQLNYTVFAPYMLGKT
jgi:hypothetical protein